MIRKKIIALAVPVIGVLTLDQLSKFWIRLSPSWHNTDLISGWLSFHYTQNPGMALGMQFAPTRLISIFAIIATIAILSYVIYNHQKASVGYMVCIGLIIGGAFGNITDRLFMGLIQSTGGLLQGHVVDFIHFNLRVSGYPVFPYIFNVADIAITSSIIAMIVFHKQVMPVEKGSKEKKEERRNGDESDTDAAALSER